nr:hypothetical protein [Dickeya oryzae]
MNRRGFLTALSTATVILTAGRVLGVSLPTPHLRINLWDHTPSGGGGPTDLPHLSARGALSHIATPYLEVFTPAKPNGQAILVSAGGGYQRIEMGKEAWPAAAWLVAQEAFLRQLNANIHPDGEMLDFSQRDALHLGISRASVYSYAR